MVYNAEGSTHIEALGLSMFVPVVSLSLKQEAAIRKQTDSDKYDKKRLDYIESLQVCKKQGARYTVIIEDDALPARDFWRRLKFVLQYRVPKRTGSWVFLRLFYPEKYQGWGNEPRVIAELLACTALLAFLLTGLSVVLLTSTCSRPPSHSRFSKLKQIFLVRFSLSCVLAIYILLMVGRPHLLELWRVSVHFTSVVQAPGCCIQGVVYPISHLEEVISYLQSVRCNKTDYPVDIALDHFPRLNKWLAVPNMMTHIGIVSSLPKVGLKTPEEMAYLLERNP